MRPLPAALVLLALSVSAPCVVSPAAQTPSATPPVTLTPQQAIAVRRPGDLQWSPDGARLVFTIDEPASGSERRTHLWVYDRRDPGVRQFTNSAKTERHPRWSPDGTRLAFLSDRDGPAQIYLLSTAGGEAWALTKGKRAVQDFEWSPDGRSIAFLAPEAKTDDDEKKDKDKDDARVVDKDDRPAHLWTVDVATAAVEAKRLIGAPWKFSELAWTPAGDRLIVVATDRPESDQLTERIFGVSIATPAMTEVLAPVGPFSDIRVSPDGASLAYVASRVDGPSPHDLFVASLADRRPRNVSASPIDRPVQDYRWRKDGSLFVVAEDGFRDAIWTLDAAGKGTRASPTRDDVQRRLIRFRRPRVVRRPADAPRVGDLRVGSRVRASLEDGHQRGVREGSAPRRPSSCAMRASMVAASKARCFCRAVSGRSRRCAPSS